MLDVARNGGVFADCLGLDHDGLREVAGDPIDWDARHTQNRARIWRYGNIEFHFNFHRVFLVFSDHGDLTAGGDTIAIEPWIVSRGLLREQFEVALRDASIRFSTNDPDYDPFQRLVTTEGGVTFVFREGSDNEVSGLVAWSIHSPGDQSAASRLQNPL